MVANLFLLPTPSTWCTRFDHCMFWHNRKSLSWNTLRSRKRAEQDSGGKSEAKLENGLPRKPKEILSTKVSVKVSKRALEPPECLLPPSPVYAHLCHAWNPDWPLTTVYSRSKSHSTHTTRGSQSCAIIMKCCIIFTNCDEIQKKTWMTSLRHLGVVSHEIILILD